jgi:hypothetical protein
MSTFAFGFVRIHIQSNRSKNIRLFIPIIFIALLCLPLLLIAAPFYFFATAITLLFGNTLLLKAPYYAYQIVEASRGTEVAVEAKDSNVLIQII